MGRMLVDTDPIDRTHAECLNARAEIRRLYQQARRRLGLHPRAL